MTETLLWSLSQLKVTGGFQRAWALLVEHASFLSERKTHACLPIFPPPARSLTAKPAEKGPQLWGEKLRPGAARITKTQVCLSARSAAFLWRTRSRSTPRFASSRRRLPARAFYSHIFCWVTWKAARSERAASVRRGLRIQMARAIHAREFVAAQENHARCQPSALVDPAPELKWIHQIQRLRCLKIGYFAAAGVGIPGGMKSEPGTGGHAYPVMRNRAENDGAGRGTITIDDHSLA
jgi:hypothetical protein